MRFAISIVMGMFNGNGMSQAVTDDVNAEEISCQAFTSAVSAR